MALDTPSGLDTTTGIAYTPAVHATTTLTLALPKVGLLSSSAGEYVGKLFLADIGVPEELYARLGLTVSPIFTRGEILPVK